MRPGKALGSALGALPALALFVILFVAGCTPAGDGSGSSPEPASGASAGEAVEPWFTDVTEASGLDFVHRTGAEGNLELPEIMGSGAALFDADGDGDLDAYLVSAAGPDGLFLQAEGGRFAAADSGLGEAGYGMGVAVGDADNDGDLDLYLANLGADGLLRNRGDGTFEDATEGAGVDVGGWSSSAAFFDFDRDGFLDLYVARYVAYDSAVKCYDQAGRHEYCGPTAFSGVTDVLLRNRGDGTFEDASARAGIAAVAAAGLGVVCEDFDGDGWPDVYVANDADPNQLWINRGHGTFEDQALVLGASVNALGLPEAGMGVVAADFDNDLDLDLFLTHLEDESNTFYRNTGPPLAFEDATARSGVAASSMPYTGFGTAAFDADLDGRLDLLVANGRVVRGPDLGADVPAPWNDYAEPNLFYRGAGEGRFQGASPEAGELASRVEVSRGVAVGDVDGDGDLDVLLNQTEGPARLFRNDAPRRGAWLSVDARDPALGRTALGAVITLETTGPGGLRLRRTVNGGFSYQSASDARAHFGLGSVEGPVRLTVRWPDGATERFTAMPNTAVVLVKGQGESP